MQAIALTSVILNLLLAGLLIFVLVNGHEWPFNSNTSLGSTSDCSSGQISATSFLLRIVYPNSTSSQFFGPSNQTVPRDQVYGVGGGGAWIYHLTITNYDSAAAHHISAVSVPAPWSLFAVNPTLPITIMTVSNVTITVGWPANCYIGPLSVILSAQ